MFESSNPQSLKSRREPMDVDPRQYEQIAISDKDIHNTVVSYLVHNYFNETAEAFISSVKMKQPLCSLEYMYKRKEILRFTLEGNVPKVIELTEEIAPDLLEKNKDLHFDLLSLHFVELVCSNKCTEALYFAHSKLTSFSKVQKTPWHSWLMKSLRIPPCFACLVQTIGSSTAKINRHAEHKNQPGYMAMERLLQQATLVKQHLTQELGKGLASTLFRERLFEKLVWKLCAIAAT